MYNILLSRNPLGTVGLWVIGKLCCFSRSHKWRRRVLTMAIGISLACLGNNKLWPPWRWCNHHQECCGKSQWVCKFHRTQSPAKGKRDFPCKRHGYTRVHDVQHPSLQGSTNDYGILMYGRSSSAFIDVPTNSFVQWRI